MAKGFFVTGTDTGVGKTIIAGALIRAIHMAGFSVCGMKPVETGCRKQGGVFVPSDGMYLKDMARMNEKISSITPCCFELPLAPMVAAELEGGNIDLEKLKKQFRELADRYEAVVVEGIGGLLVPIKEGYFVADLAASFGLPLVIVSSPFLGTINHTLLTVDYALKAGLEIAGIIINYSKPPEETFAEKTNPNVIKKICPVPLIGVMPYLKEMDDESFDRAVLKNLDMSIIKKYL